MKFYTTIEDLSKLKKSFLNLKLFSIISIPDILAEHGYEFNNIDDYGTFIIGQKIQALIKNYTKSKRIRGIIYCNPNLNKEIVNNLISSLKQNEKISEIVLFDDYNVPKVQYLYYLFPEVMFFPSIKKIRIIECKPLKNNIVWKLHNF